MERCKSNCDIYKKEHLSTISNNSISKRKHRVPLMGKTVLLAKHADITVMQHVNESDIITKLVLERFKNVLDYYRQRSSRRSRHRGDTRILKNIMEEKADETPTGTFITDEDQIVAVEATPVLAEIVEESSSEDDPLEEKVEYDPQQFLFDALGGELHNYPSNSEVQSNVVNYNNDDCSVGTSNISTLLSKSNSSYSIFSRKMRRCNTYASSTMYDKINDNVSLRTEDCKATQYINEAATQHHVIVQASKALNLCLSCKEFRSSLEYVEAEKILLLAIERREAVLRELRLIEYEDVTEDCSCLGHITISNLAFHLIHSSNLKANLITQWFLAIVSCGPHVFATEIVKLDDQNQISFKMYFTFHSLSSDFEIIIKLYYLNVLNASRYSRRKLVTTDTTMCPSPNHLLGLHKKSDTRHKRLYSYERREPSFTLYGTTKILISDLSQSTFKLTKVSNYSEPLGNVNLKISSSIKFSLTYSGFLTVGSEAGGLAIWNRRWCQLDGRLLKYWNYPQEQEFSEPVNIIDLSYCVISSISRANRELCARPRTLVIETGRKSNSDDENTLMVFCKSSYTITRHYLSADSVEEMEIWEKLLNSVLSSLRNWNCMDCPLNFNN